LIHRFYLPQAEAFTSNIERKGTETSLRWIKKNESKSIQTLDLLLLDEFGLPLIVPKLDDETRSSNWIDITLITQ
jgi:hypothetical protein